MKCIIFFICIFLLVFSFCFSAVVNIANEDDDNDEKYEGDDTNNNEFA